MVATDGSQLVVVGASAGGVEALGTLVSSLPVPFPAPVVVAQHLDPTRRSHLPEILARRTALQVVSVDGVEPLRPGVIYLVPADHDVAVTDHEVRVSSAGTRRPKPSVNELLASSAEVYGEGLVAIVLTGEGSDGAEGARAVKAAGGTVIIQDPRSAAHPSMPLSLAPTTVDFAVPVEAIGAVLGDLLGDPTDRAPIDDEALDRFLTQVRDRTGIDFSSYKRPTIIRRLHRRMTAVGVDNLTEYIRFVTRNPGEYDRLASTFLIKVTDFFRDPELFEYLRTEIVPNIVEHAAEHGREIRVWSAGCATGEEAYSLAILLAEVLGEDLPLYSVRVFATDLDPDAVSFARRGVYTRSAMAGLPPELVERYFQALGEDYEIRKQIRTMTVFGQHDLGQRAPFPRIDLAVTRNVLIYFTTELQRRALQLFAFSLREGGYLVLGKSESVTPMPDHFVADEPRLKVFRRHGERVLIPPSRGAWSRQVSAPYMTPASNARSSMASAGAPDRSRRERPGSDHRAERIIERSPQGIVQVDPNYDIQLINEAARRLLQVHGTAMDHDLIHLATPVPSDILKSGIDQALRGQDGSLDVTTEDPAASEPRIIRLRFVGDRTEPSDSAGEGVTIFIEDVSESTRAMADRQERIATVEGEATSLTRRIDLLIATNEELLAANRDLAATNAELRSTNEELLVGGEELQAATEEVETLNEELQATNEELETLNEELQATVEELNTTNDDLEARSMELQETAATLAEARRLSELQWNDLSGRLGEGIVGVVVTDRRGGIVVPSDVWADLVAEEARSADGTGLDGKTGVLARVAGGAVVAQTVVHGSGRQRRTFAIHGEPLRTPTGSLRGGFVTIRLIKSREP